MNISLYLMRVKCLLRNKETLFWNLIFPIALASLFYFAFNNLWTFNSYETMKIAYVSEDAPESSLLEALNQAKINDDTMMFEVASTDKEEATRLLKADKIEAYIVYDSTPHLFIEEAGINETILKSFLDSWQRMELTVQIIMKENPQAIEQGLIKDIMQQEEFIQPRQNGKKMNPTLTLFYSLLAFTCILAGNQGLGEVINIQADQSTRGARVNVSPVHKMRLFLCNMAAAFTVHIINLLMLFFYMYAVLKIEFGDNMIYIILLCLVGSLAGIFLGAFIGVCVRGKTTVKEATLIISNLVGAFLAGMMAPGIRGFVSAKVPIAAYLNPVSLISDGLHSLYYYDTYDRYYLNLAILGLMVILMIVISFMGLRRKNYESI